MAVLTKDQFFEALKKQIGSDSSDDSIQFLENMTDTYNALEQTATGDGIDWKNKYEELDKSWTEKYRNRFFTATSAMPYMGTQNDDPPVEDPMAPDNITIDRLFKPI